MENVVDSDSDVDRDVDSIEVLEISLVSLVESECSLFVTDEEEDEFDCTFESTGIGSIDKDDSEGERFVALFIFNDFLSIYCIKLNE
jgi:hypothetical protein